MEMNDVSRMNMIERFVLLIDIRNDRLHSLFLLLQTCDIHKQQARQLVAAFICRQTTSIVIATHKYS
jgi:hypothetical protein